MTAMASRASHDHTCGATHDRDGVACSHDHTCGATHDRACVARQPTSPFDL